MASHSGLQHYPSTSLREFGTTPTMFDHILLMPTGPSIGDWRATTKDLRRLRSGNIVLIERMLRNHQPHDVLNQIPANTDWRSKTFKLALKIERLVFKAARSLEEYLDQQTLAHRVKVVSRYLVRIRMRKNIIADGQPVRAA